MLFFFNLGHIVMAKWLLGYGGGFSVASAAALEMSRDKYVKNVKGVLRGYGDSCTQNHAPRLSGPGFFMGDGLLILRLLSMVMLYT